MQVAAALEADARGVAGGRPVSVATASPHAAPPRPVSASPAASSVAAVAAAAGAGGVQGGGGSVLKRVSMFQVRR